MNNFNFDNSHNIYDGMLDNRIQSHIDIFNSALSNWTERQQLGKYNELSFKFYDGIIGYIIAKCNECYKQECEGIYYVPEQMLNFLNMWKYQGTIYRVIDSPISKIKYNKLIASWTKSVDSFDKFNHLNKNQKYTFLVANTNNYFGFDVNKYRQKIKEIHPYTEHEKEVIFPMNKEYIVDKFYGTLDEFKKYISKKQNDN